MECHLKHIAVYIKIYCISNKVKICYGQINKVLYFFFSLNFSISELSIFINVVL